MTKAFRWSAYAAGTLIAAALLGGLAIALAWRDRPSLADLNWQPTSAEQPSEARVTATWFGISTLLFDDGETQILIDGTFTRVSAADLLLQRKIRSDIGNINFILDEYRVERLAAIVPVHAHFDHAIDVGNVANRSAALVLGSESIANIARGAQVPVDQYQILADRESRHFGNFTVTTVASNHVPTRFGGDGWSPGHITEPLMQPARPSAWRRGSAVTVIVAHPLGTTIVQGSAGFREGQLEAFAADTVFLGVAGLASQGQEFAERYWHELVTTSGAERVIALHFDDFTQPLGSTRLFPEMVDAVPDAAAWLNELAAASNRIIERPEFGVPIPLY